ncbi:inositol monophosphatase family protein [Leifsonia sp. NPDC102414]|uniref:inositol monophosphatase family protein n=1 Tax=Leifsonia sp. NPDC102414 TaxID=3364124 RepID=UPI00382D4E21
MTPEAMHADELLAARTLALDLGAWAAEETRSHRVTSISTKADPADLVTELDRSIELRVREQVLARFPGHAFVGEEYGGAAVPGHPTWYLDPVDGTTNLANGIPWTAFSLALAIDDRPLVGVVADPWHGAVFDAVAGQGARRNGDVLRVEAGASTGRSSLGGGVVGSELAGHRAWPGMRELAHRLTDAYCTLRVMGSGTLTLLGPAAGRGTGAIIHRFSPIDHLAATLIAHEAGAVVLGQDGRSTLFPAGGGVLVAAPAAAEELYGMWEAALLAVEVTA